MNAAVIGNLQVLLSLNTANYDKGLTNSEQNAKKLADRLSKDLAPSQQRINALIRDFVGNKEISKALEYATAVEKVGGATKLTAGEQAKTNRVVQEAIEKYRALGQQAPPQLIALANATKQAQKPTDELGGSVTSLMGKAKALAGVFGVTLGAGALVGFAKHTFDAADQIGDLATKMGVSTDAAQRFQYAARQSGADIEDVSRAILAMNKGLADGDKSTVSALNAAGLKFQDIRGLKPEEAFRAIAEAVARIPDPMLQSQIAMELFGKSGAELLPMIRDGSLKAADGARVMSEDTIKALKDAKQAWQNFWNDLTTIVGGVLADLGPEIKQFLNDLKEGVRFLAAYAGAKGNPIQRAAVALGKSTIAHFDEQTADRVKALAGFAGTSDVQEIGMSPGLFGFSPTGGPSKPKHWETREEREAREKLEKERATRLGKILDEYTSKGAHERIADLSAALARVDVKDMALVHIQKLREELNKLAATGEKLGPILERFRLTTMAFAAGGASDPFSRRIANYGDLLQFMGRGTGMQAMDFSSPMQLSESQSSIFGSYGQLMRDAFPAMRGMQTMDFGSGAPQSQSSNAITSAYSQLMLGAFPKQEGIWSLLKTGMGGSSDQFLPTIMSALTGGGNVGKSISALVGGNIGASLQKRFSGTLGNMTGKLGGLGKMASGAMPMLGSMAGMGIGMLGDVAHKFLGDGIMGNAASWAAKGMMFGPWGAAIGAGVGAIVGAFKKGQNATKKAREEFAKELGFESAGNMYEKLKSLGAEGAKLANIGQNVIGKHDVAAQQKWMTDVTSFFDRLEKVPGKVQELTAALGKFGGAIPKQLDSLLDSILGDSNLSADLRKQLEGVRKPTWQSAQELATTFGIDSGALGQGFNTARLADSAFELKRGIDLFSRFDGSDQGGVLRGMADEFSALANEAKKNNVALPRAVEGFIRQVDEMNLLLDENGNRIDSSLLTFADMEDEYEKQVVSLLESIRDLLSGKTPTAAGSENLPVGTGARSGSNWFNKPRMTGVDDGGEHIQIMPGFAGGTHGAFMDFGAGTPVMLHGKERVLTEGEGSSGGGRTMLLQLQMGPRTMAEILVPFIPGATKRYAVGR